MKKSPAVLQPAAADGFHLGRTELKMYAGFSWKVILLKPFARLVPAAQSHLLAWRPFAFVAMLRGSAAACDQTWECRLFISPSKVGKKEICHSLL